MKKTLIALIAIAAIAVASITGYLTFGNPKGQVEAGGNEQTEEAAAEQDGKVQEFEATHSYGKIQDEAIAEYLDKLEIAYTEKDGQILVEADRSFKTIKPSEDTARAHSSVEVGLSKTNISDAVEFVYSTLTEEDVKNILAAEKRGFNTVVPMTDEHLADLVKEDQQHMVTNVIKGIGHVEQVKDLHYGESKTIYELSSAVAFLYDETETAFNTKDADGELIGMNRWLQKIDGKWYLTKDYLVNILPVVAQITEGAEVSVKVIYAEKNWGLDRKDQIQLRRCVLSTEPDDKAAIEYRHYFKDGSLMERPASNIRDERPELPSKLPKVEKKENKKGKKGSGKPNAEKDDGKPNADKDKDKPTADKTKRDPNWKPKDESEMPEHRPKDDKGPGEFEPTPKVPKSDTDSVQGSQYQPIAKPQIGGISTTINDLAPQGTVDNGNGTSTTTVWRQSEGGQTVTDQYITDNQTGETKEFIENAQATTDPIGGYQGNESYTVVKPDDAQNGTNNGEFHMD